MSYTLGIYTLGCKVNQYESEAIAEKASKMGFIIGDPSSFCDVYIINTCTVTAESDRKSRQFIRRAISVNPDASIIVTGCFSQVAPEQVAAIDGVDFVLGSRDKMKAVDAAITLAGKKKPEKATIAVRPTSEYGFEEMEIEHFPRTRAYIKIEDGCESHCTYCIIPRARGKICSKPKDAVLSEIEKLADSGCPEVVLTGIETASYGIDLENYRLPELLRDVDIIAKGKMRVRLGSLDPSLIKPAFVEKIAPLTSLAPHFHLSMQSGCDRILALMKRKYNTAMASEGIKLLRDAIPGVQFTTDLITAFPGETEDDFKTTYEFCEKTEFLNAHIFTYSRRIGTPAATMQWQVPSNIGKERTNTLISLQSKITDSILEKELGKSYDVLFETDANGIATGHTPSFIEVKVKSDGTLHSRTEKVKLDGYENGIAFGSVINSKKS